jgi:hypothetical protein
VLLLTNPEELTCKSARSLLNKFLPKFEFSGQKVDNMFDE